MSAAPDSALPAYERRMQLLEGSIKKRLGKIVKGEEDHVVEALFRTLLDGGWLNTSPTERLTADS